MRSVVAAAFAAALALAACGGDSDTASTSDAGADGGSGDRADVAAGDAIVIKDFKFTPEKLSAKVGDKITVTNQDSATHTLTAKDKSLDTGNLDEGGTATVTLDKTGTVDYVCEIHDYMTGSIEVS